MKKEEEAKDKIEKANYEYEGTPVRLLDIFKKIKAKFSYSLEIPQNEHINNTD